jgi:tetratricopeptide (TPR) repeat protein
VLPIFASRTEPAAESRFAAARATLERAIERRTGDSVLLHHAAMVASLLDDHPGAVRAARRALELDPKNPAPYSPLGMALRGLGDHTGAVAAFREMIELAPTAAIGYVSRGAPKPTAVIASESSRCVAVALIAAEARDGTPRLAAIPRR